ncbi:hypothetical protein Gohar_028274 [Gossypium harknessii]|uniref:Aminotransferase-like plant mobile domain-containing protein n=1 Tax=Gossypium harknessii TaxID=34285 RepID=A0A7J9ICH5_9ROSI|nr:hypothetical protein [Gossypium harknessii]
MIEPYLEVAGFLHVSLMLKAVNWTPTLISVLVERWRPKTYTFHLPCDECAITLEDVQLQLGLPMDESVITGSVVIDDWSDICKQLLGNIARKFPKFPRDSSYMGPLEELEDVRLLLDQRSKAENSTMHPTRIIGQSQYLEREGAIDSLCYGEDARIRLTDAHLGHRYAFLPIRELIITQELATAPKRPQQLYRNPRSGVGVEMGPSSASTQQEAPMAAPPPSHVLVGLLDPHISSTVSGRNHCIKSQLHCNSGSEFASVTREPLDGGYAVTGSSSASPEEDEVVSSPSLLSKTGDKVGNKCIIKGRVTVALGKNWRSFRLLSTAIVAPPPDSALVSNSVTIFDNIRVTDPA